ncbi:winged helix-turn-helix domain-containing protein [Streptomyces sp. NBC_01283]|uniref:helix-turn-helix domain-containing protein n=1 Tax=Streptomyces sp. NBC_01283 TaxID=2903812 RepID=UPI00352C1CBF
MAGGLAAGRCHSPGVGGADGGGETLPVAVAAAGVGVEERAAGARLRRRGAGLDAEVWRLLKRHGWSCQVPVRRALERDEAAIEVWKAELWPRVKVPRTTGAPTSALRTKAASR